MADRIFVVEVFSDKDWVLSRHWSVDEDKAGRASVAVEKQTGMKTRVVTFNADRRYKRKIKGKK